MTPAALLPHERLCPDCNGYGFIQCQGVHPSRGSVSQMEAPDEWEETCEQCDGKGVVLNDRRDDERGPGTLARDFTKLRNALALERATVVHLEDQVDALIHENRRLREAVHKAARVIESDLSGSSASRKPDGPATGPEAGESPS